MDTAHYLDEIVKELQQGSSLVSGQEAEELANAILAANKVFTAGGGRSGFAAKSFAMRLMHIGLEPYVIGETVTPNFEAGDLIVIGSGSGETKSLVSVAEKARQIGGRIAAVTTAPDSSIAQLADTVIQLPGAAKDQAAGSYQTIQPMGSLFEQTLMLFYDAIVLRLMERKGQDSAVMYGRHANLE